MNESPGGKGASSSQKGPDATELKNNPSVTTVRERLEAQMQAPYSEVQVPQSGIVGTGVQAIKGTFYPGKRVDPTPAPKPS